MQFVLELLERAHIKQKYIDTLSTPASVTYFETAFTDPSYDDKNNYLFLRSLGTLCLHRTLVWYVYKKFPHVNQKTLSQIKINMLRDSNIGEFIETMGMTQYILYSLKQKKMKDLSQYIFEAILGAVEFLINHYYKFGIGNIVSEKICIYVLDQLEIVTDESLLENPKSKLKEMYFDCRLATNEITRTHTRYEDNTFHVELFDTFIHTGIKHKIGEGTGSTIINAEQEASCKALVFLKEKGLLQEMCKKDKTTYQAQPIGPVHFGKQGDHLKDFILNLIHQRVPLVSDLKLEKMDVEQFQKAFTSPDVNKMTNYELFETLGDNLLNNCVMWYISNRFPHLNVPDGIDITTKLKIHLIQTKSLAKFSELLGFYECTTCLRNLNVKERAKVMEDIFESFFAVLNMVVDRKYKKGMGFIVCYRFLATVLDNEDIRISYDYLVDTKTQLKELFDAHKSIKIKYHTIPVDDRYTSTISESRILKDGIFGKYFNLQIKPGQGYTAQEAEQRASKEALQYYKGIGISRPIPKEYLKFCV